MCAFVEAVKCLVQAPAASPVLPTSTPLSIATPQIYGITQLPSPTTAFTGHFQPSGSSTGPSGSSQKEPSLPERPDQQDCHHYMKTGECKFGSSCRYHHPRDTGAPKVIFSPAGLPLRPVMITFLLIFTLLLKFVMNNIFNKCSMISFFCYIFRVTSHYNR